MKRAIKTLFCVLLLLVGCTTGIVTSRDEVASYIHTHGELPDNYLTKQEAMDLGWVASEGNLWEVTDQMSIRGRSLWQS